MEVRRKEESKEDKIVYRKFKEWYDRMTRFLC